MSGKNGATSAGEPTSWFDSLPLLRGERIYGFADYTFVMTGMAIASWSFLYGGTIVVFVGLEAGIASTIVGFLLTTAIIAFSVMGSTKYGLEHFTFMRSHFGRHGVKPLIYLWLTLITIGWTVVLAVMTGRATTNVINELAGSSFGPDSGVVVGFCILSLILTWLLVAKGPIALKWMTRIVAPGLVILMLVMLILLLTDVGWSEMAAAQPFEPFGIKQVDFMMVVEFNLAGQLAFWPALGNLARLAKKQRGAWWGHMIGLGLASVFATIIGIMAGLAIGDSDPTVWMLPLAGTGGGIVALVFIAIANLTSMAAIMYLLLVSMRQEGVQVVSRVPWSYLAAIMLGACVLLVIRPSLIYDNFFNFVLWSGLGYGPFCAVSILDYYVMRRRRIDMLAIYDERPGSRYDFWRGWNWPALIAGLGGSLSYLIWLNPATLSYRAGFEYVSATIPAMLVGATLYLLFTLAIVRPLGKGGYAY